jgi:hypothetical protein
MGRRTSEDEERLYGVSPALRNKRRAPQEKENGRHTGARRHVRERWALRPNCSMQEREKGERASRHTHWSATSRSMRNGSRKPS